MPLKNPYPDVETKHMVVARVGADDFFFLKRLFPMRTGLIDKTVSILFKKFIDELRIAATNEQLEPAWYVESPTHRSLDELLERFQRCSFGLAIGTTSGDNDAGTTERLHQEVQRPTEQRPNAKGKSKGRRRSNKKEGKVND